LLKADIGDGISVEPQAVTVQNLCERFIESKTGNVSPESIDAYEDTIERLLDEFVGTRNIKTITEVEAQSFVNDLSYLDRQEALADYSRLKHLKNSQVIFNFGVHCKYLRSNPFKGISIKNLAKDDWHFVNPKEFKALIDNTPELRVKAFYTVMYFCGLRFGEAVHLRWDKNIDFINSQIQIKTRKAQNGLPPFRIKNHQDRSVDCPSRVMSLLRELKAESNGKNPYVFLTDERLDLVKQKWAEWQKEGREDKWKNSTMANNINRNFGVHCKNAGIVTSDRLSVHSLRKAYGTNLADLGTPVHTLKDLMGHSSITTTMKFYIHVSDANKKKAVQGLEGLME